MDPTGIPEGRPGVTEASPTVGKGALGSTDQPPEVEAGQGGGVNAAAADAYADDEMPVGFSVAHCAAKFEKSGAMGVGVP